jgi:hypothetical protein
VKMNLVRPTKKTAKPAAPEPKKIVLSVRHAAWEKAREACKAVLDDSLDPTDATDRGLGQLVVQTMSALDARLTNERKVMAWAAEHTGGKSEVV